LKKLTLNRKSLKKSENSWKQKKMKSIGLKIKWIKGHRKMTKKISK